MSLGDFGLRTKSWKSGKMAKSDEESVSVLMSLSLLQLPSLCRAQWCFAQPSEDLHGEQLMQEKTLTLSIGTSWSISVIKHLINVSSLPLCQLPVLLLCWPSARALIDLFSSDRKRWWVLLLLTNKSPL